MSLAPRGIFHKKNLYPTILIKYWTSKYPRSIFGLDYEKN